MGLARELERIASRHGDKIAVDAHGQRFTFHEWQQQIHRRALWLTQQGLRSGDCLALYAAPSVDYLITVWACFRAGIIAVPINSHHLAGEVAPVLRNTSCAGLFADQEHLSRLNGLDLPAVIVQSPADVFTDGPANESYEGNYPDEMQPALIVHTSGTTGRPKGVAHTHQAIFSNLTALHGLWQWTSADVVLHTLPLHHVHGLLVSVAGSLLAGSTLVFHERFDAAVVLHALATQPITLFMGVPTMYYRLVQQDGPSRFPAMRLFVSGSAPLPLSLAHAFYQRFGMHLLERAGMTEALMIFSNSSERPLTTGSVGKPLPGIQVRLVDERGQDVSPFGIGEIWIKSPYLFRGYWNDPEATTEAFTDGWFRTGDLGRCDADGNYYLVGRIRDVIKSGGVLIFPSEIEQALLQMPGISDCAVVGIPDAEFGERIKACVVASQPLSAEDVIAHCRSHLASYKKPAVVEFYDSLPRNAMGKIDRLALQR
ncbi:MAG: AMP-binding protein [Chitinophagales bacterium]|nr:AMP-binding protein [Chitinophagales bacterium]MDW8393706.1 AMP-binding protein [Chitinophagales bacterium]